MKPAINIWLAAALIVAVAAGFIAGRMSQGDKISPEKNDLDQAQYDKNTARSSSRNKASSPTRNPGQNGRARDVKLSMKTMISHLERSPMANMDFDGMFEIWEIMRGFSEDDVLNALSSVEDIKNPQLRMTMQMMLMNRWGKLNGQAAIEHALQDANKQSRMTSTMGVFMSWTKENPGAAFDWYEDNQDKLSSGSGMYGSFYHGMIFQALAHHDLPRALTQVDKIENQNKKTVALSSIASAVATDPVKLNQFLSFLDKEEYADSKQQVMSSVMSTMAMQDPESARTFISAIEDPEEKKKLSNDLIQSWSYLDPEAAIEWGMKQSKTDGDRQKIISGHLSTWAGQDSDAAMQWYDKQPDHLKKDSTAATTASRLGYMQQYEDAFSWAERIGDATKIEDTKKSIYQIWQNNAPAAAKAWAEGKGKEIMQGIDLSSLPDSSSTEEMMQRALEHSTEDN